MGESSLDLSLGLGLRLLRYNTRRCVDALFRKRNTQVATTVHDKDN
jgi:hypothetical protein